MEDKAVSDLHYIAAGVKKDCLTLIEKFSKKKTYDFHIFLNIWKEMKFPFIFGLRDTFAELIEFTEEVFLIVKNVWLQFDDLFSSVCAFYLLAAVYRKQPTRNMVKIRLTFTDLERIFIFLKKCQENGIPNILQMYNELDTDGAFMFVVFERQYGFERNLRKYFHNPPDLRPQNEENEETETEIRNYMDGGKMDLFEMYYKEYDEMKKQIAEPPNYVYLEWINILKEGFDFLTSNNPLPPANKPKNLSSTNNQGEVRKNIKEKAFMNNVSYKSKSLRISREKNVNLNVTNEIESVQQNLNYYFPNEIINCESIEENIILEEKQEDLKTQECPTEKDINDEIEKAIEMIQQDPNISKLDRSIIDLDFVENQENIEALYNNHDKIEIPSDNRTNTDIQPLVNNDSQLNPIGKEEDIILLYEKDKSINEINASQPIIKNYINENPTGTNICENNPEQLIITNIQDLNNKNITKLKENKTVTKRKYNKSIKSNKKTKIDVHVNSTSLETNNNPMIDDNNLESQEEYLQSYNPKDDKVKEKNESNYENSPQEIEINIKDITEKIKRKIIKENNKKLNNNSLIQNNCKTNLTNLCLEIAPPKELINKKYRKEENIKIKTNTTKSTENPSISNQNQTKKKFIEMLGIDKKNDLENEKKIDSNLNENSKLIDFQINEENLKKIENSQPFLNYENVTSIKEKPKKKDIKKNKNEKLNSQMIKELIKTNLNKSEKTKKQKKIENIELSQQIIDKVTLKKKQSKKKKRSKDIQAKINIKSQIQPLNDSNISFSLNETIPKTNKDKNKNQIKGKKDKKKLKSNKIESSKEEKTSEITSRNDDDNNKLEIIDKINKGNSIDNVKNEINKKSSFVKKEKNVTPTKRNLRSKNKNI